MKYKGIRDLATLVMACAFALASYAYFQKINADIQNDTLLTGKKISQIESEQAHEDHDFQIIQLGEMRRDQFLIDRKDGRTWAQICAGKAEGVDCDGLIVWMPRVAIGLNGYTQEDYFKYLEFANKSKKLDDKQK